MIFGSWSYVVVISVYVFDRTHSTQWLAALGICRWGPGLLFASYGGVIADRYERVTVLVVSSLASAVLMTGLAVAVATDAPVGLILAIVALSGVAPVPYRPAAGALTPTSSARRPRRRELDLCRAGEPDGRGRAGYRRPVAADRRARIGVAINAASFALAAVIIARLRVRSRGGAGVEPTLRGSGWPASGHWPRPVAVAVILFCALDSAVYGATRS